MWGCLCPYVWSQFNQGLEATLARYSSSLPLFSPFPVSWNTNRIPLQSAAHKQLTVGTSAPHTSVTFCFRWVDKRHCIKIQVLILKSQIPKFISKHQKQNLMWLQLVKPPDCAPPLHPIFTIRKSAKPHGKHIFFAYMKCSQLMQSTQKWEFESLASCNHCSRCQA